MIEVHCVCGKLYRVPDDKAGKKLQCRRCGAVSRIPRPRTPDDQAVRAGVTPQRPSDSDIGLAPPVERPALGPDLRLQNEVRRCPSCGFADDPSVVVCVRCGFDWRTQRRMQDAVEQEAVSQRRRQVDALDEEEAALQRLSWWALSPLGLFLGPWVVLQAGALQARLRGQSGAVGQARLIGGLGFAMWLVVGLLGLFVATRGDPIGEADAACRARMSVLARVAQAGRRGGKLPPGGKLADALSHLVPAEADPRTWLVCPSEPARPFSLQERTPPPDSPPGWLVAWDPAPHPAGQDRQKKVWRAARLDGEVELFERLDELQKALDERRPGAGQGSPVTPTTPTTPGPTPGPSEPPAPGLATGEALEAQVAAARGVLRELEGVDPDLSQGILMSPSVFTDRVGATPEALLGVLIWRKDPADRALAVGLAGRLDLARQTITKLLAGVRSDRAPEVRFAGALALRRLGEPGWLPLLVGVGAVEGSESGIGERAVALVGVAVQSGPEALREVLLEEAKVRQSLGLKGDGTLFPLPAAVLPQAAQLLAEPGAGSEAAALLFSAEQAGLDLVLPLARSGPREQQLAALAVVDKFRLAGRVSLPDYLALIDAQPDPEAQAQGLTSLQEAVGPLPEPLVEWVLKRLRGGELSGPLQQACQAFLRRIGEASLPPEVVTAGLTRLVEDLFLEGDHKAVLDELGRRTAQEQLDGLIRERWDRLAKQTSEELRVTLVRACRQRPWEGSVLLLLEAAEDPSETVRLTALQTLSSLIAVRNSEARRVGARVLANRLKGAEKSARAVEILYQLAAGGTYCTLGEQEDEHRCSPALLRALQQQARKGEPRAIRALATHPSMDAVEALLGLLVDVKDVQQKLSIASALQNLTGISSNSPDPMFWKGQLSPVQPKTKNRITYLASEDRRRMRQANEQAQGRISELEKRQ